MKILKIIREIFFDEGENFSPPQFHNETEHYRHELPELYLDQIEVMTSYHSIKDTLEAYKYRSEREKGDRLARFFFDSPTLQSLKTTEEVLIVPVPMHWSRYILRGYNHISLLSKIISKHLDIPSRSIMRSSFSPRQSHLSKEKRLKNREGGFSLGKGVKIPEIVVLIDDVISTGSTANACAKILKDAGVKKVYGLFLASNRD